MAYGVKYRMNFGDLLDISYEIDIYLDGYASSVIPIFGDSSFPIQIDMPGEDDPLNPVCGSNATIGIMDTAGDTYSEFFDSDVYEYYVDIKRAGGTWWKGFLIPETYEEQYTTEPYGITLTFGDSLNELALERYDASGTLRASMETNINILVNCFNELPTEMRRGYREMINMFEDSMNDADTEGLLEQLYIYEASFWEVDSSDDVIKGINCLDVIRHIMLSLGCRIILSQDVWYIQRLQEMKTAGVIKYVDYDSTGTVTGNSTLDLRQPISARGASMPTLLRPINNDAVRTFNREYQEVEFSYNSKNVITLNNNVVVNWDFSKGLKLQDGSPVPLHWTLSAATITQMGVVSTGIHLRDNILPVSSTGSKPDIIFSPRLVIEDTMLAKTAIINDVPIDSNNQIKAVADAVAGQVTRETYFMTPESPADNTVTWKNLLHSTSDHMEIRVKGYFDYTYAVDIPLTYHAWLFFKWTIKLGANYYNTGNTTWDTSADNRVWKREQGNSFADPLINTNTRRHSFDFVITMGDFITTATSDLTITAFIPENNRGPYQFGLQVIDSVELVIDEMQATYVSSDSTEFSLQKVLGSTGSTSLRNKRKKIEVKHGDGPSAFSINSFRLPTTNLATSTWSTRGGAESLAGYKMLILKPYFEILGAYRQSWNGSLYGFLEPHNTVSNLESKIFIIKKYSFDLRSATHTVILHEVGTNAPVITYVPQIGLGTFATPTVDDDFNIGTTEQGLDDTVQTNQGGGVINNTASATAHTGVVKSTNDSSETAKDYPL